MGYNAAPLERLIEQFAKLPGIGRKGATRLAYQVLSMDKEEALDFARAIEEAHTKIHRCRVCQNFTEDEICAICTGEARDHSVICVVENPRDVTAFERTREYRGLYHVLHGLISPMDGVGAVQVVVTLESTGKKIVEKDVPTRSTTEENKKGEETGSVTSSSQDEATVYEKTQNGAETPYVVSEEYPAVRGVLVIAEGGGNPVTIQEIQEAVMALFQVGANKIKVVKMK